MDINSGYPIRHRLPPGGGGERAGDYFKQDLGLSPLPKGERQRNHLFALSSTLRIRQAYGLGFSTDYSTSPPSAIVDYCSALTNFHAVSRAIAQRDRRGCWKSHSDSQLRFKEGVLEGES